MYRFILITIFFSISFFLPAQQVLLEENFDNGIPSDYINEDYDGLPLGGGFKIAVSGKWFVGKVSNAADNSVLSTSHHTFELPTDNWLVTPKLRVSESDTWLTWDAKSVHFDLREGYKVMVSTTGNNPEDFHEIFSTMEEDYSWTRHVLPLSNYVGQDIYIAFVHNSTGKFLLALDNFYVGELVHPSIKVLDETSRFSGEDSFIEVKGVLHNTGKDLPLSRLLCKVRDEAYSIDYSNSNLNTADSLAFSFKLPAQPKGVVPYSISLETAEDGTLNLLTDSVISSYFPRALLVEKGTGVWCTSCPGVIPMINRLKERYKDQLVYVESHSEYNDYAGLSYPLYDKGMHTANYPVVYFNRYQSTPLYSAKDIKQLDAVLLRSTIAKIDLNASWSADGEIEVHTNSQFAFDVDNSSDKYRIGFAIVENELKLDYNIQKNNSTSYDSEEYRMMDSPIHSDFMFFHNVVRGTESAFIGIANSLPADISKGEANLNSFKLKVPSTVKDINNISVVSFVLNYHTDDVLNTSIASLGSLPSGIGRGDLLVNEFYMTQDGCLTINLHQEKDCVMRIWHSDGRMVDEISFDHSCKYSFSALNKGCYIVTLYQGGKTLSRKFVK